MAPCHWMASVVAKAGFGNPELLGLEHGMSTAEAWFLTTTSLKIDEAKLADAIASTYRFERADIEAAESTAVKLVPENVAREYTVFPLRDLDRHLIVATADPTDPHADQAIGFASGRAPVLHVATPSELRNAIDAAYSPERAAEALLAGVKEDFADMVSVVEDSEPEWVEDHDPDAAPVVKLANMILHEAIARGASDIHLQPTPVGGVVRYRVDGVLRTGVRLPLPVLSRVISRIKVLGKLDITDSLRPQDGRTRVAIGTREFDLRISTVPARQTEKAVVRVLDSLRSGVIDDTNIPDREVLRLRRLLRSREGIVCVTGPTGSGKTTTLYAALQEIATDEINVMTVEDPVEYEISGLTQIEVNAKQGVTFVNTLRAILRQDPDVIFVGEIRDEETARIAAQAAMTGHLVLTTLHTNDAVGVVRRLEDLGIEPGTIVEVLRGALAQRLVRRVCPNCAEHVSDPLTKEELRLEREYGMRPTVRATGCARCDWTGYRGRLPLVEMFSMNAPFAEEVLAGGSPARLNEAAVKSGMVQLLDAGLERARKGEVTLEELERVIGSLSRDSEQGATELSRIDRLEATAAAESVEPVAEAPPAPAAEAPVPEGVPSAAATDDDLFMDPWGEGSPSVLEEDHGPEVSIADFDMPVPVLVVEDDPVVRTVTTALVRAEGHPVVEFENGREAADYLARGGDGSLAILDLNMPEMDGLELLRVIRGRLATAGLPVIVLTAAEDAATEAEVMAAGADDYLRKPIEPQRFMARVRAVLCRQGGLAAMASDGGFDTRAG